MASGRKPCGSRATMMRSSARKTSENAPSSCSSASRSAPASVRSEECAIRCRMTSVSLEAWKMAPRPLQIGAQFGGVGDVAVVRDRDLALVAGHRERLRVEQHGIAGGGVARVTDGELAGQFRQHVAGEDVGHVAHRLVGVDFVAVARCRCRRSPGRDAAARRGRDTPAWMLRGGRKWRPRRTRRETYRAKFIEHAIRVPPRKRPSAPRCPRNPASFPAAGSPSLSQL